MYIIIVYYNYIYIYTVYVLYLLYIIYIIMPHRSYMIPIWYRLIMYIQYSVRYGGIVITNQQDWVCITNNGGIYIYISGWWFQLLWKILVRLDHHPNYWGNTYTDTYQDIQPARSLSNLMATLLGTMMMILGHIKVLISLALTPITNLSSTPYLSSSLESSNPIVVIKITRLISLIIV